MPQPCPCDFLGFTKFIGLASLMGCLSLLSSCSFNNGEALSDTSLATKDPIDPPISQRITAKQNWTTEDSLWFYTTPQGSTLLPYDIFLSLELPSSNVLFRSDENLNRLRYLPQTISSKNPDGLPIGWVKETYQGRDYIGLTCAACHTAQINIGSTGIIVDGAPGQADMDKMMRELEASVAVTLEQSDKLSRMQQRLARADRGRSTENLVQQLTQILDELRHYNRTNAPIHDGNFVDYGFARLDAFGRIYNRIFAHLTPGTDNFRPATAPVNYPFLWDTPQHDFVQWNGIGDNADDGHVGRNTGEVLGVFASFDLTNQSQTVGYPSSALLKELMEMEAQLAKLVSPSWRELANIGILPPIDDDLAARGKEVYHNYQCHQCHKLIDSRAADRQITAQFASLNRIKTDPLMALNALQYEGNSGLLEDRPISLRDPSGPKFASRSSGLVALSHVTEGVILNALSGSTMDLSAQTRSGFAGGSGTEYLSQTVKHLDFTRVDKRDPTSLLAYKARPLNGIWATAPYLHNGSVPTLEDLFKPSCSPTEASTNVHCRPNRFTVGSRELDTSKIGFKERSPEDFPEIFVFDTQLPGNSNHGHEFASGVTEMILLDAAGKPVTNAAGEIQTQRFEPITVEDRQALVEFLKTL
ncbi:MAG: di-heme-cytochrome C peroxidase [Cellvibrio sp.]